MPLTIPSVVSGMTAREYHAIRRFQQSSIRYMLQSPAHWKAHDETPSESTPQMQFGTVVHAMILEPHTINDVVRVLPADAPDKRSNAGKAWHADFASGGHIIMSADDYARAAGARTALLAHPAARLLDGARVEVSMFWDSAYGAPCKARADILAQDCEFVLDVKTTRDASPQEFMRSMWNFRYDIQAAWYIDAVAEVLGHKPSSFVIAAVEVEPPHGVMFYRIEDHALEIARRDIAHALYEYVLARESGVWHGYTTEIMPLSLPAWAKSST